jgi:hypothetical protein
MNKASATSNLFNSRIELGGTSCLCHSHEETFNDATFRDKHCVMLRFFAIPVGHFHMYSRHQLFINSFCRRMNNTLYPTVCPDECDSMEYVTDVTTTRVSNSFIKDLMQGRQDLSQNSFVVFTVYYRTFDITTISYHGKVQ